MRVIRACWMCVPLMAAGCGLVTAPVSIPAALAANKSFDLRGRIVDPEGRPLDDVLLQMSASHELWDPTGGHIDRIEKSFRVSPEFHLQERATGFLLTFSKPGYEELRVRIFHERFGLGYGLWGTYPLTDPLVLTMHPAAAPRPGGLRYVTPEIVSNPEILLPQGHSTAGGGATSQWGIDLDAMAQGAEWWDSVITTGQPLRANSLYYTSDKRAGDGGRLTLHLTAPDGGMIRFVPKPTDFPLAQMTEAPAEGYQNDVVISPVRVAEMLTPRADEKDDFYKHYEFYYFRAGGKYGRVAIHRPYYWSEEGFDFTIEIQRTGSRVLPHVPGW